MRSNYKNEICKISIILNILGFEDDVVIGFVINMLESENVKN